MPRYYQTTPIYYVNDAPHLGTAYTMVVADALARWRRLAGEDVFFLTGTDEHGQKIDRAAAEAGLSPQEMADRTASRFVRAWAALGISNDDFIRTTETRHHAAVQAFLGAVRENGYIEKGSYEGLYCVACEDYFTEAESVDGNCPIHGRPLEWMSEENYFFKLSLFEQKLIDYYEANPDFVRPLTKRNEALGFIRSGLRDISITRTSVQWGVPVPWDSRHVFYVWYDALINYATAIGYGTDQQRFGQWWPAVHHLIGKDIIRFHCVWWPAMCMAAGIEPPHRIVVHGWLLVGGEKMSKTRLNQIDPVELVADLGVDAVRYHLLRDVTLGADGDFSYEGMVGRYNSDLANNFGNLASRVATVVARKCGGVGPAPRPDSNLAEAASSLASASARSWNDFAPQDALEMAWRMIREANAELEATEPWKMDPGAAVDGILGDALEVLRLVAVLASPAMPDACAELWRRIGMPGSVADQRAPGALQWGGYPGGLDVEKGSPLFPRRTS